MIYQMTPFQVQAGLGSLQFEKMKNPDNFSYTHGYHVEKFNLHDAIKIEFYVRV
jgi:hypothetical protein